MDSWWVRLVRVCDAAVALHEGRPFVSATGAVELWHPSCFVVRHERGVEEVDGHRSRSPRRRARGSAAHRDRRCGDRARRARDASVCAHRGHEPPTSLADDRCRTEPSCRARSRARHVHEGAPPRARSRATDIRCRKSTACRSTRCIRRSLDWTHPVTGTDAKLPEQSTGGSAPSAAASCAASAAAGHCGVDLGGPIGRQIVAVGDGVVVRVERSELGRDGRSGRYVRIEHDDGTLTSYMHLDHDRGRPRSRRPRRRRPANRHARRDRRPSRGAAPALRPRSCRTFRARTATT